MKITPSRLAAFEVLQKIDAGLGISSELLPEVETKLSAADRALCHEIVLGVLRRRMTLDRQIDEFGNNRRLDDSVRIALRIGLFQLNYLDRVPDHAAINESVELVKMAKKRSASGFVNALLRRAAIGSPQITYADEFERLSVETSHPRWLVEKWAIAYGRSGAFELAEASNRLPKIAYRLTAKAASQSIEVLLKGISCRCSEIVPGCFVSDRMSPRLLELAADQTIYFQDEASQLVAFAVKERVSRNFLDVCAAPGSKTGAIAHEMIFTVAGDASAKRIAFMRENLHRQGVAVDAVRYDAAKALPFDDEFDTVLVDAPCSGTGTIAHNPEIRYRVTYAEIAAFSDKQLAILRNASKCVAPLGKLIYSTCSLEPEENDNVIERFLAENDEFSISRPAVPDWLLTDAGYAQTLPNRDNMDGFFIAELRRN